jgi:hypothetical protein
MAKVVTERPRSDHGNPSRKCGRRLNPKEFDLDDHGPNRAPIARRRQYGSNWKEFSDLLGPLRRYPRKQVGRPWDKVSSEITQTLDSRALTGQHIFDRIRWEVEQQAWIGEDGGLYHKRGWGTIELVDRLYVHPVTRLLLLQAEAVAWIPRRTILEDASGASGIWHLGIECSGYPPLLRGWPSCLGATGGRLVHSPVPAAARAARSGDHSQRWTRGADLQPRAL